MRRARRAAARRARGLGAGARLTVGRPRLGDDVKRGQRAPVLADLLVQHRAVPARIQVVPVARDHLRARARRALERGSPRRSGQGPLLRRGCPGWAGACVRSRAWPHHAWAKHG